MISSTGPKRNRRLLRWCALACALLHGMIDSTLPAAESLSGLPEAQRLHAKAEIFCREPVAYETWLAIFSALASVKEFKDLVADSRAYFVRVGRSDGPWTMVSIGMSTDVQFITVRELRIDLKTGLIQGLDYVNLEDHWTTVVSASAAVKFQAPPGTVSWAEISCGWFAEFENHRRLIVAFQKSATGQSLENRGRLYRIQRQADAPPPDDMWDNFDVGSVREGHFAKEATMRVNLTTGAVQRLVGTKNNADKWITEVPGRRVGE